MATRTDRPVTHSRKTIAPKRARRLVSRRKAKPFTVDKIIAEMYALTQRDAEGTRWWGPEDILSEIQHDIFEEIARNGAEDEENAMKFLGEAIRALATLPGGLRALRHWIQESRRSKKKSDADEARARATWEARTPEERAAIEASCAAERAEIEAKRQAEADEKVRMARLATTPAGCRQLAAEMRGNGMRFAATAAATWEEIALKYETRAAAIEAQLAGPEGQNARAA